jgi:hypothetical protein
MYQRPRGQRLLPENVFKRLEMRANRVVAILLAGLVMLGIIPSYGLDTPTGTGDSQVVITLKNGDRITGEVVARNADSIQLRSDMLGPLTIPKADMAEESVAKTLRQEHTAAGPVVASPTKPAATSVLSSVQIALNAPESVVVGTQNQNTFGGSLLVLLNLPGLCSVSPWYTAMSLSATHDRKWKVKSAPTVTDTFDGTLKVGHSVFGKSDWYAVAGVFGNSSLGVGLQQAYGTGLSTLFYSSDCSGKTRKYRLSVTGDLGFRYIHQRLYAPGGRLNLAGIRPSADFTYTKLRTGGSGPPSEVFSATLSLWAMPMVNNIQATQAGGLFQLSFPLTKSLSLALQQEDDFVNNAPKLKRKNYLRTGATISYTFPAPDN